MFSLGYRLLDSLYKFEGVTIDIVELKRKVEVCKTLLDSH